MGENQRSRDSSRSRQIRLRLNAKWDDVLVGMPAKFTAFAEVSNREKASFAHLLQGFHEVKAQKTCPASAQMIAASVDGAFPELLGDLVIQLGAAEYHRRQDPAVCGARYESRSDIGRLLPSWLHGRPASYTAPGMRGCSRSRSINFPGSKRRSGPALADPPVKIV